MALSRICPSEIIRKELYFYEIKEIILYHQKHINLTQLAYQSAWKFLIGMLRKDGSLEEVIVNELHFVREAKRELEELSKSVDWKKKGKERRKANQVATIGRWIDLLKYYFDFCIL
ncbi:uncharacterized protein MONOS_12109 [Monocercomonoides exilis]|uniref:uncharacterized protein n=1 Tax=Monocercomonoides exilis TaxID=2049356 RepID=UPI0035594C76|nr:hypothetical protein MONOS_12109 [Monocercomonoides exilis]|eukprot:MONOS_12109.1-p1 / transcript=MONOS_12109.1 / gene=MONOS_12109 / organism=Monocercomonoides_exilis_PA203 / gene_product=unspecified product / transcript_product=unspecified product / location=Mono_scaffold00646:25873-26283(+) / protein_length=116 / sequence_SO=supercontig / SO=protein_coding / is_pseudo=false